MKKLIIVSILLIITLILSFFIYPYEFKIDGGSCNQGITLLIHYFVIIVCGVFSLISILTLKLINKISLYSITISTIIWLLWCFAIIRESFYEFLYLLPLLIVFILYIAITYNEKNKKPFSKK
jgi:hypothetical protein